MAKQGNFISQLQSRKTGVASKKSFDWKNNVATNPLVDTAAPKGKLGSTKETLAADPIPTPTNLNGQIDKAALNGSLFKVLQAQRNKRLGLK